VAHVSLEMHEVSMYMDKTCHFKPEQIKRQNNRHRIISLGNAVQFKFLLLLFAREQELMNNSDDISKCVIARI